MTSQLTPSGMSLTIWHCYRDYLWIVGSTSWIGRIASGFRILSFLVIFPIVVLALLDLSAYGIARTLGVIDDVKASTSDKVPPPVLVHQSSNKSTSVGLAADPVRERGTTMAGSPNVSQPRTFYASDEGELKLSGIDVFSPAASQPPSPTLSRSQLRFSSKEGAESTGLSAQDETGLIMRRKNDTAQQA